MMDVLGLLGMLLFCSVVIALAAGVTGLVVRFSPSKKPNPGMPSSFWVASTKPEAALDRSKAGLPC